MEKRKDQDKSPFDPRNPCNAWLMPILFSVALLVTLPRAELLKVPAAITNEKGSIVVTESNGKPRWTADWTMEPYSVNSRPAVRFTEKGKGHYSPFTTAVQWSLTAVWTADGSFKPLQFDRTFTDTNGRELSVEKKSFDSRTHTMSFERSGSAGHNDRKSLYVPDDAITVEGIAGVLRGLPFEGALHFPTHLVSNEPKLYDITIEGRGRERVKTPFGEFECYKVEFVPHVGLLGIVKPFLSKTYFWFTVEPPHFWVRYEGYENGVGTPQITMDLKTYERQR